MEIGRREFILTVGAAAAVATIGGSAWANLQGAQGMYGLIGKMTATSGQRDALVAILLENVDEMPGCLSYVVATDPADENAIWITEVWDSKESHEASLKIPSVQQAIAKARPIIAGFGDHFITSPVGGHGLPQKKAG
jgi:quinol monooxygenase YgiN